MKQELNKGDDGRNGGMRPYQFTRPPHPLRRAGVKVDNLAIVPTGLRPYMKEWQAVANRLPEGGVLIILPASTKKPQRKTLETLRTLLRARGHHLTRFPIERFSL